MQKRPALAIQQHNKARAKGAGLANQGFQPGQISLETDIPGANHLAVFQDRLVAGQIGRAQNIHLAIKRLALAEHGVSLALRVQYGAHCALAFGGFDIGGDADKILAFAGKQRGAAAGNGGDAVHQGGVQRLRAPAKTQAQRATAADGHRLARAGRALLGAFFLE